MSRKNKPVNSGWYISNNELMEKGYEETVIYHYDSRADVWRVHNGEKISPSLLPVPEREMWPLRPTAR